MTRDEPLLLTDRVDPARAEALEAVLGEGGDVASGTALPPLSHFLYFWNPAPEAARAPAHRARRALPARAGRRRATADGIAALLHSGVGFTAPQSCKEFAPRGVVAGACRGPDLRRPDCGREVTVAQSFVGMLFECYRHVVF